MSKLCQSVESGDVEAVRNLLHAGEDVKACNEAGWTALHVAAKNNCVEIAELLLENGADVNARGAYEPIHMDIAGAAGERELAEDVLAQAAGQDVPSWVRATPVHLAASFGHTEMARVLLGHGAEMDLLVAGAIGDIDATNRLLEEDGDANLRDADMNTPLHFACREGHEAVVKVLVLRGADVTAKGEHGLTPMHQALAKNPFGRSKGETAEYVSVIRHLLGGGAEATTHVAAALGDVALLEDSLGRGVDVNAAADGFWKRSPLHYAADFGQLETVNLLIEGGASLNPQDMSWRTPLDLAEESGHRHVADMLLERGAKRGKETT